MPFRLPDAQRRTQFVGNRNTDPVWLLGRRNTDPVGWRASKTSATSRPLERSKRMPLLEGKKALIAGIANHRSIGWAIAQAFAREGAQLAFTYQERMEKYVKELAEKIPNTPTILCDVQSDEQIDSAFEKVGELFGGKLDTFIHWSPSPLR